MERDRRRKFVRLVGTIGNAGGPGRCADDTSRKCDKGLSDLVECRFFGAMSIEDTAAALGLSPATVKRHWTLARSWLYREMQARAAG